jgi:hypothetical protein
MFQWLWDRYIFTGLFILWAMTLISLVTLKVFGFIGEIPDIPAATGTTFGSMFGIGAIIEVVRWRAKISKEKKDATSSNSNKDT